MFATTVIATWVPTLFMLNVNLLPAIPLFFDNEEGYTSYYPQDESDSLLDDLLPWHRWPDLWDEDAYPRFGLGQNDDLATAQQYARDLSSVSYLSRLELISWLVRDGFTRAIAEEAVDTIGIDYAEVALAAAQNLVDRSSYSEAEIVDELSAPGGSGFSDEEVAYALEHLHVDWVAEAADQAWLGYEDLQMDDTEIRDFLTESEYTPEQIKQAMERLNQRREESSRS